MANDVTPRLEQFYKDELFGRLKDEFNYENAIGSVIAISQYLRQFVSLPVQIYQLALVAPGASPFMITSRSLLRPKPKRR